MKGKRFIGKREEKKDILVRKFIILCPIRKRSCLLLFYLNITLFKRLCY